MCCVQGFLSKMETVISRRQVGSFALFTASTRTMCERLSAIKEKKSKHHYVLQWRRLFLSYYCKLTLQLVFWLTAFLFRKAFIGIVITALYFSAYIIRIFNRPAYLCGVFYAAQFLG